MICPACQTENIEGSDECVNCGASLYGLDLPGAPQGANAPEFVNRPVAGMHLRPAFRVGSADPVSLAVRFMQREDVNCVLVVDGDELAGILTGWDILQKVAGPNEDLNAVTCGQVMTKTPTLLQEDDSLALVLNAMASNGIRHLPIVRGKEPVGIVVATDLFRHISPHLV